MFYRLKALSCLCSLVFLAVTMSEIAILALAVGVSCGAILVLLCVIVAVRFCRKKRLENDFELRPQDPEWTDPTVWWGLESRSCSASSWHWCGVCEQAAWVRLLLLEKDPVTWDSWGVFLHVCSWKRNFDFIDMQYYWFYEPPLSANILKCFCLFIFDQFSHCYCS